MTANSPRVGQRVKWNPDDARGTIIAVLPNGMVRVEWDTPDPDTGENITENGLAPHLSLRLL
jgi:hypothetical protein